MKSSRTTTTTIETTSTSLPSNLDSNASVFSGIEASDTVRSDNIEDENNNLLDFFADEFKKKRQQLEITSI